MGTTIIAAIAITGLISVLLGVLIGVVSKIFAIPVDTRVELVLSLLPGANCGGCGKAGCADFAQAVVAGELPPGGCPVNSAEQITQIAQSLGIEAGGVPSLMAVVLCGGDMHQMKQPSYYNGVSDCVSAQQVGGGPKGCAHGCLGMASCARACPFGAIEMVNNLAVVHRELCVGCGACVATCPRGLVKLVAASADVHIYCSSPEKANVKRSVCQVPCIACRKCVKAADEGQLEVVGFRVQVDYTREPLPDTGVVARAECPTGCLLTVAQHLEIERGEGKKEAV